MPEHPRVAIVDYGMGNLFSVRHACEHVGFQTEVTGDPDAVLRADAVIVPGMGAFGDAMDALRHKGLDEAIREAVAAQKPFLGVCLGLQLLFGEGHEFGVHKGLGIVDGEVVRFDPKDGLERGAKVPQVAWNAVRPPAHDAWAGTPLAGIPPGEHFYFVHSYYARPRDPAVTLALTRYRGVEFASAIRQGNVSAVQFHPERSAAAGLRVYRNFLSLTKGDRP